MSFAVQGLQVQSCMLRHEVTLYSRGPSCVKRRPSACKPSASYLRLPEKSSCEANPELVLIHFINFIPLLDSKGGRRGGGKIMYVSENKNFREAHESLLAA